MALICAHGSSLTVPRILKANLIPTYHEHLIHPRDRVNSHCLYIHQTPRRVTVHCTEVRCTGLHFPAAYNLASRQFCQLQAQTLLAYRRLPAGQSVSALGLEENETPQLGLRKLQCS